MLRLKSLRKFNGLSRKDLGKMIGVSESTVAAFEQGLREPTVEKVLKMSEVFNVNIAYLYGTENILDNVIVGDLSDEEKAYILIKRIKNNIDKKGMN